MFSAPRSSTADAWVDFFLSASGGEICCAGGGASRRLCNVRHAAESLERGQDGAQARCGGRAGDCGKAKGADVRRFQPPGRALVVHERREGISIGCPGSGVCGFLWVRRSRWPQRRARSSRSDWIAALLRAGGQISATITFYFDTWAAAPPLKPYLRHFAAYYYNRAAQWGKGVAINYKNDMFAPHTGVIDVERGQLGDINPDFWQTDTALGNKSWCCIADEEYKTAESLIGKTGRHRQQEWQPPAEHRPAAGWNHR